MNATDQEIVDAQVYPVAELDAPTEQARARPGLAVSEDHAIEGDRRVFGEDAVVAGVGDDHPGRGQLDAVLGLDSSATPHPRQRGLGVCEQYVFESERRSFSARVDAQSGVAGHVEARGGDGGTGL